MNLQRIQVKYFVKNPDVVDLPAIVPVFHKWIQKASLEGLLIDVADYKHVHEGPGIVLIGHEGDYAMDMGSGRPGLLYVAKRKEKTNGDLREQLRSSIRLALIACQTLEAESGLKDQITFDTTEAEITFSDQLHTPNRPEILASLDEDIRVVVGQVYEDIDVDVQLVNDNPREPIVVRVSAPGAADLATLIGRVKA